MEASKFNQNAPGEAQMVGAYYAKTHLSELLDRVEQGERITITRNGKPVAELEPYHPPNNAERVREAVTEMRELASQCTLGGITIRELIEDGRRY